MPDSEEPISDKQRAANRANAAHSTGPRSPKGKSRSSQNARKHGFTASTFVIVRVEDIHEVANLKADLEALYQPVNSQELFAVDRIALAQHSILRAARLESGLFTAGLDQVLDVDNSPRLRMNRGLAGDGDIEITRAQNRNFLLGEGFHRMAKDSNVWSLCLRYQAQAERQYRRAIEEFDRLKALRDDLPEELPEELPNEPISEAPEQSKAVIPPETAPIPPTGEPGEPAAPPPTETSLALAEWGLCIAPKDEPLPPSKPPDDLAA